MQRLTKLLLLSLLLCSLACASGPSPVVSPGVTSEASPVADVDNDKIGRAFARRTSYIQVEGEGTVIRLLADDLEGPRHQRFIVRLPSGQTLLVAHNIDVAPRIDGLAVGDTVRFSGEYVWSDKGGLIHWTHHDPQHKHVDGWVRHNGRTYK